MSEKKQLTKKDFVSNIPVKWCSGCGDYIILSQLQDLFSESGLPREKFVVVSGIGCSGRFPYYMNTYGFHTIHGRAPTIATGIKITNPSLQTWVITGDGDGLSIGANHLFHTMRKNIGIKIIMLNNQIYALTKGQLSPTSENGLITKTSPLGSLENPSDPIKFALGSDCAFIARTIDTEISLTKEILKRALITDSTIFIEVIQNCITFNPNSFIGIRDREIKEDFIIRIVHDKPLIFGKNKDKGIIIENFKPKIIQFDPLDIPSNIVIYDETNRELAYIISSMKFGDFPLPIGIFMAENKISYEEILKNDLKLNNISEKSIQEILEDGDVWEV